MLLAVRPFEMIPKHKEYFFTSDSFALNWHIFVALANKKLLLPLQCRLKHYFVPGLIKVIEYWVPAVNVWFNPCVSTLPIIKISFPLLSMRTDLLVSTPKITSFLPKLPSGKECYPRVSNPIP